MPDSTRVDRLIGWRRDLHQRPATAFAEDEAAAYVADVLHGLGFDVATGIGGTGVVGSLTLGRGGRVIRLRADLDGLPLDEVPGRAYGSRNAGAMHACGHDGHMAMVLGATAELAHLANAEGGPDGVVRAVVSYTREFAPTVNDVGLIALVVAAAREALGSVRVTGEAPAITASEDFGVFGGHIPACFAFVGNGTEPGRGGTPLHSRDYDFNDDILTTGVDYYLAVVSAVLRADAIRPS
ncbi:M20/M25/M40 family metallo-hydrolase [Nostocoides vanveenii]|uniref:Amidohydrolase n=1 Tax=Nostocoides vanveenii TaxID=330835 RepID=A0ABN2KT84_9MICO